VYVTEQRQQWSSLKLSAQPQVANEAEAAI
jgi:hypothetical protein